MSKNATTQKELVLLNRDIFRLILSHALSIKVSELFKNYELIYNCTLTCKKWREIVFQLFIPHFRKYNYENEQFNFDNVIYTSRLIKRKYFESDNHSHYKQPNIEHDDKFILVKPEYYQNFLKNSENLRHRQQSLNTKFARFDASKICKICSTVSQTRSVCGVYLHKLHLKKLEREKAEKAAAQLKLKENIKEDDDGNEGNDADQDGNESEEAALPDVEGVIPVDRPDIEADDLPSDGDDADNDDDGDADADGDDDVDGDQDDDNI